MIALLFNISKYRNMKVGITGHTSGIGLALFNYFKSKECEVTGFSRSNGHDIYDHSIHDIIVERCKNFDIFINNAYAGHHSISLLYKFYDAWKDSEKYIFNISSDSADGNKNYPLKYAVMKSALNKASAQLQNTNAKVNIVNIRPGYVDTPRVEIIQNMRKLNVNSIVETVSWILSLGTDIEIREISIRAK